MRRDIIEKIFFVKFRWILGKRSFIFQLVIPSPHPPQNSLLQKEKKHFTLPVLMKYAFLAKNFNNLSFEQRVVFLAHAGTALFCFFPWLSIEPLYDEPYWHSAFGGSGALIGAFVFLVSLGVSIFFADKLFESKKISLPFPENSLFFVAGIEQVIFLILAWSVLLSGASDFESSEIRFGISLSFLAQAAGIVAAYLQIQKDKVRATQEFFELPRKHSLPRQHETKEEAESFGGLFENKIEEEIHGR